MPKVLRRRGVLAFLCGVALLQAGCGTIRKADLDVRASLCPGGVGSSDRNHPLICVDDNDLSNPNPYSVTVWDREGMPGQPPSNFPVIIQWSTKSGGGRLGVEFSDKGCIEPGSLRCNGNGRCIAKTKKQTREMPCNYTLNLDGRVADPVVIVQPCCL